MIHLFGIRHHGPGSTRSLLAALEALEPDCVLIEGPPEADEIVHWAAHEAMQPPVAMLTYCPDNPELAVFYPLAEFSPEWQAIRFALARGIPVRFMDLPQAHNLAIMQQRQTEQPPSADAGGDRVMDMDDGLASEATQDPLGWLAQAAGHADGESWWNQLVEERGNAVQLFAAIAEAMQELRAQEGIEGPRAQRDGLREAYMRQRLREVSKSFERVAVVCGAWHVPALALDGPAAPTAKADAQVLKGLPKVKATATWVPWTYRNLASSSGYGAGVSSPGWYEFLWRQGKSHRAAGWLARVARLLREHGLDCSSAHVIEGIRLAETLAALRGRPVPGLAELDEACVTVLCHGEAAPLKLIAQQLSVGDRLGSVPEAVPTVPLQRDLDRLQKSLRLKPETLERTLDLDLRKDGDLARSRLLHRLRLLGIDWGTLSATGRSARGTFHEVWALRWEPGFAIDLIVAARWGQTVEQAATARALHSAREAPTLNGLAALIDQVLLADLADAVAAVTQALESRAAVTGDAAQLLAALPPLANVFRYGNVRKTDAHLVAHVVDGLILRASIGLPMACGAVDQEAAEVLRKLVLEADRSIALRESAEHTLAWREALRHIALGDHGAALLRGVAARLLLDAGALGAPQAEALFARNLSVGAEAAEAAAWLQGFLNGNAMVLLHDQSIWRLLDDWLVGLTDEHFLRVLPLVRRTFSDFAAADRRDLASKSRRRGLPIAPVAAASDWNEARAALPVPLLRTILGLPQP